MEGHHAGMTTPAPITVWVATEFDIDDGGRAWLQAATNQTLAQQLCQIHHDANRAQVELPPEPLNWKSDPASEWQFGQTTWSARVSPTGWYEVRQIEVTA